MNQGQINGVIFLDLKKAFDTIDHHILLSKLQAYGIRDHTLKWFQSYFDQRKQICMLNNCKSDIETIRCGVPQGSNLGPLLFLIYGNGKTLFKQGGPFSTKAGIHRGPVSRYRLFIGITF